MLNEWVGRITGQLLLSKPRFIKITYIWRMKTYNTWLMKNGQGNSLTLTSVKNIKLRQQQNNVKGARDSFKRKLGQSS